MNVRLYVWQRLTAAIMAPLVLAHIVVIFYATRKGLSAADILARTRGSFAWASFYGAFVVAAAIHATIGVRNVLTEWSGRRHAGGSFRRSAVFARRARGRRGGAAMNLRHLRHRESVLWIAALVHRLSGLALAVFLPVHFLTLGLAIRGEAPLESFLRWSDQPLVKLAESALVFLLMLHMLGGLRLLVIENLPWRDGQKEAATIAAGLSAAIAFFLLARML
jgi:succinate dehydrogenase cytochrome b556 subunit